MSKREKIILGLTVLVAISAGWLFLFSNPGTDPLGLKADDNNTSALITEVAQSLGAYNLTATEQIILEKAEIPWPTQSFLTDGGGAADVLESAGLTIDVADPTEFSFTGYIEIGKRRLAIINDEEYETGEQLTESPYRVFGISPEQVLLEDSSNRLLRIPMTETTKRQH